LRIVIDTNVALSGLLWGGPPNQILRWARDRVIRILACSRTVDELKRVLHYSKFSDRLFALKTSPEEALAYFHNLVTFVPDPTPVPSVIKADPFDNLFLALAMETAAPLIVSGDKHLLDLENFANIHVVTPSLAVEIILRLFKHK
jgi:putative PIN family toxin of toxin-antitoxin system